MNNRLGWGAATATGRYASLAVLHCGFNTLVNDRGHDRVVFMIGCLDGVLVARLEESLVVIIDSASSHPCANAPQ